MKNLIIIILGSLLLVYGCISEPQLAQIRPLHIQSNYRAKHLTKNATQFISIAYTDLFGATIKQAQLRDLEFDYLAFGDKPLIRRVILKHLIEEAKTAERLIKFDGIAPDDSESLTQAVKQIYLNLYNREADEAELLTVKRLIHEQVLNTEEIYLAFMTTNEYLNY